MPPIIGQYGRDIKINTGNLQLMMTNEGNPWKYGLSVHTEFCNIISFVIFDKRPLYRATMFACLYVIYDRNVYIRTIIIVSEYYPLGFNTMDPPTNSTCDEIIFRAYPCYKRLLLT